MTNRQRLLKTNEYDLLCRIQKCIDKEHINCVIDAITGNIRDCPIKEYQCDCERCIQDWLNEEEQR